MPGWAGNLHVKEGLGIFAGTKIKHNYMYLKFLTAAVLATSVFMTAAAKDTSPAYPEGDKALKQYFIDNLPASASAAKKKITLMLKIDAEGKVVQALPQGVEEKIAGEAVKIAKRLPAFTPATVNGSPAEAWMKVIVPLDGKRTAPKLDFVTDYSRLTEIIIIDDEEVDKEQLAEGQTSETESDT